MWWYVCSFFNTHNIVCSLYILYHWNVLMFDPDEPWNLQIFREPIGIGKKVYAFPPKQKFVPENKDLWNHENNLYNIKKYFGGGHRTLKVFIIFFKIHYLLCFHTKSIKLRKYQNCVWKISVTKYPSETVSYSKYYFQKFTYPNFQKKSFVLVNKLILLVYGPGAL